ncbi:MAG: hypothetical protein BAJALOKI2v1_540002 [Promethearchaeota archaeon]|nr:MAG: hypothetical protein BAJALOKI2v1_540002 [Candidatus Lokiarchaeota archaeon]
MKAKLNNNPKNLKLMKEQFITLLEGVLFKKEILEETKKDIKQLLEHKITEKEFKRSLLIRRGEMVEDLLLMIPYFFNLTRNNKDGQISIPKQDPQISEREKERLKQMIEEREALLTQVAKRVQKISESVDTDSENPDLHIKSSHPNFGTFILDGSNIARHNQGSEVASIRDVIGTKMQLLDLGVPDKNIFIIIGSALYHYISEDEIPLYKNLLKGRNCVQAPAGTDDDWFIIQHALKHNSYIITNDRYKEYREKSEEYKDFIESHSIRYNIIGEDLYFQEGFIEKLNEG